MDDPQTIPDTPARACATCAAAMAHDQDWCLECGTAAPGRLGGLRPGWRAVTTTLALTLVLVGGAGAASYAALSSDANREAIAAVPADGAPVAQAPPAVATPPAPVKPAEPPPTVEAPASGLPDAPDPEPIVPADTGTTAQVTPPAVITPPSTTTNQGTTPSAKDEDAEPAGTVAGSRGAGTSAGGGSSTSSKALAPITLGADAVALYDPYKRAVAPGDLKRAHDGTTSTTFLVGAPDDPKDLQVGVVIDLGSLKQVRAIDLTTSTPGGDVEVFTTDSSTLPPEILDTRWDHPASRKAIEGEERINLPKGGAKFRYVTLWFTSPPTDGRRIGITELGLLG